MSELISLRSVNGDVAMVSLLTQPEYIDAWLDLTALLEEHPEDYDGPCMCRLCMSYADIDE